MDITSAVSRTSDLAPHVVLVSTGTVTVEMDSKVHGLRQVWACSAVGCRHACESCQFGRGATLNLQHEPNLAKVAWTEGWAGDFPHVFPLFIVWCSQHGVMWRRTLQPSKCGGQNACLAVALARSTARLELLRDNGPTQWLRCKVTVTRLFGCAK